jgi:hypothetical protein
MEGYGFLQAAYVNAGVGALVVRGISDLLSDKGEDNDDVWQPAASYGPGSGTAEVARVGPLNRWARSGRSDVGCAMNDPHLG